MEMTMAEKIRPIEKVDDLTPVQRLAQSSTPNAPRYLASAKADALQKANEAVAN